MSGQQDLSSLSVKDLKELLDLKKVSWAGCVEKTDLIALVERVRNKCLGLPVCAHL